MMCLSWHSGWMGSRYLCTYVGCQYIMMGTRSMNAHRRETEIMLRSPWSSINKRLRSCCSSGGWLTDWLSIYIWRLKWENSKALVEAATEQNKHTFPLHSFIHTWVYKKMAHWFNLETRCAWLPLIKSPISMHHFQLNYYYNT